jgi:hypothetical protein
MQAARNCGGEYRTDGPPVAALGDIVLKECPESAISGFSRGMIELFWMCEVLPGSLPASGGVLDQDNAVMEAMRVIRTECLTQRREGAKKRPPRE